MKYLFSNLRFRLLLVVLLAVVPSFGLTLYTTYELRVLAKREIEKDVTQLGHIISLEEDQLIMGTRQLLISLAENPKIVAFDKNYSDALLKELISHFQRYANFGVITPNGELAASAVPYTGSIDVSDRSYFRRALETHEFSIGEFQIGRVTDEPSIIFAYPVLDGNGQVKAVIFAAIDLVWLSEHEYAATSQLQAGSIFAKVDSNGIVVAYKPHSSERLGKPAPWTFIRSLKTKGHGIAKDSSPDGIARTYAFETVSGSKLFSGNLVVVLGVPEDSLLAASTRLLVQNTSALGVVAFLVFAFAWIGSGFLILRPARLILHTTEELRKGNLNARTGLLRKEGEIGRLALSVDQMAEALQNQEQEHERMIGVLRESEERYRTLVETSPDAIALLDERFKIMMINHAGVKLTGYERPDQLIGKDALEFVTVEDRPRLMNNLARFSQDAIIQEVEYTIQEVEYTIVRKDGTSVPIEIRASVMRGNDNTARTILSVLRDVSGRKQAEEEKKKIQAQLLQAQKMDSIGTLAGGVAHDFNNLLTVIVGHADFAISVLEKNHRLHPSLKAIHHASMRAADLTHQLLLFSRRQPMDLMPLDINSTVESLLKMLKRLIGEDIRIETDLARGLWTVRADAGNMDQTIMNIAVNARDAMQAGGTLTITTRNEIVDEGYCTLYAYARPGKFVCLSITDTGAGMTQEVISQIFEPFFTTKGMGKGTGLGLSVVYGIVKQHKGWVNVRSEPGKGSTFFIYLPAFSGGPAAVEEEEVSLASMQGRGERILVAEDEDSIRNLVQSMLSGNGYEVTTAADAQTAIEAFEKENGGFDLILSDVVLPDKTGVQLVEALLSRKPKLKVLLSSGYTDSKSQWAVIRQRGFRFLHKPYTLIGLLRAVKASLERRAGGSEERAGKDARE